mmetsp:Transcript_86632/g.245138  ORF Transcript_86632/g.245138 Transcript_86632/m.245138 type:complete len:590 (-) Transcript_86632:1530-3299(-)
MGKAKKNENKIIVIGFPPGTDDEGLEAMCDPYGKVYGAHVVGYNVETGESRGYGFVTFADAEGVTAAIEGMHKTTVEGRTLNVRTVDDQEDKKTKKQTSKGSTKDANKIIVAGLSQTMDDDKLKLLCEEFGLVLRASVVRNDAGKSKGFGFVTFTNKNAQQAAILKLDKRELGGGRILNVRSLEDREKRAELNESKANDDADLERDSRVSGGKTGKAGKEPAAAAAAAPPKRLDGALFQQREANPIPPGVCVKFQFGRCHRGKKCKWRHEKVPGATRPSRKDAVAAARAAWESKGEGGAAPTVGAAGSADGAVASGALAAEAGEPQKSIINRKRARPSGMFDNKESHEEAEAFVRRAKLEDEAVANEGVVAGAAGAAGTTGKPKKANLKANAKESKSKAGASRFDNDDEEEEDNRPAHFRQSQTGTTAFDDDEERIPASASKPTAAPAGGGGGGGGGAGAEEAAPAGAKKRRKTKGGQDEVATGLKSEASSSLSILAGLFSGENDPTAGDARDVDELSEMRRAMKEEEGEEREEGAAPKAKGGPKAGSNAGAKAGAKAGPKAGAKAGVQRQGGGIGKAGSQRPKKRRAM